MGLQPDLSCFHGTDIELKAGNILYQLTKEEADEFDLCSHDIIYFVEKYCRFMTDAGRKVVHLRKYQIKILKSLAKEEYSEAYEDLIPIIRNMIMMQSRQSGKCFFDGLVTLQWPNGNIYKVPINIFYYMKKGKLNLLERIKVKLYMWKYILDNI
ncbi:hypothetical protein M0Q50_06530 [bacterium]|nr:hypothetical protein [bacterium]